jgi:hypothetical protein
MLNTVRIDVAKSSDSAFHLTKRMFSRGTNPVNARNLAEKINFQTYQLDSVLYLPKGFSISKNERFRNQQVLLVLQVPVGKRYFFDRSISKYSWFDVRYNRHGGFDFDDTWDRTYGVETGKEYIMTPDGPRKIDDLDPEALRRGEYKDREKEENKEENEEHKNRPNRKNHEPAQKDTTGGYRYHKQTPVKKTDSTQAKVNTSSASVQTNKEEHSMTLFSPWVVNNAIS